MGDGRAGIGRTRGLIVRVLHSEVRGGACRREPGLLLKRGNSGLCDFLVLLRFRAAHADRAENMAVA